LSRDSDQEVPAGQAAERSGYKFYVVLLLAGTYMLNTADRGILSILVPPLKREFALSDWQIGLLAGPLFAFVYAVSSLPFATWSDRGNRRTLIAVTMLIFSAATGLCGAARSFVQLMIGRFLTGAVESATVPAANSLIVDLYPPERRVSAIAIFSAGGSFGATFAALLGGVVAHHYGWRLAFVAMGLPGLILGPLLMLSVREPARTLTPTRTGPSRDISMLKVIATIFARPAFAWLCVGNVLLFFRNSGAQAFQTLFLVQAHHLDLQQIGTVTAALGICGLGVTLIVGRLLDGLGTRDVRWFMFVPMIVAFLAIPFALIQFLAADAWISLIVGGGGALFILAYAAPLYAAAQMVVPSEMRARAIAIMLLLTNLIGTGLGPPTLGLISDRLGAYLGPIEGLRWSLLGMLSVNVAAGWAFWRAAANLKKDADHVAAHVAAAAL